METLLVYPNPFASLDKDGDPCAVCPRDTDADAGGPGRFVGARLDRARTKILQDFGKNARHELRSPRQSTKYSYLGIASNDPELANKLLAKEPIELPRTKFYQDRLREGAIIPADERTARAAEMRLYVAPEVRLAPFMKTGEALPEGSRREGIDAPADGTEQEVVVTESPTTKKRSSKAESEAS